MDVVLQWMTGASTETPHWLVALTSVVSAASAVAAVTPTPKDDRILGRLYRIVDVLALNIGRAKDRAPSSTPKG